MRTSAETRRTFFRAQVIAQAARQSEVEPRALVAALLVAPPIVNACERSGVPAADLIRTLNVAELVALLHDAEAAVAGKGIEFGSRAHIDAVEKSLLPVSAPLREMLGAIFDDANSSGAAGVFDILEMLTARHGALRNALSKAGLTVATLRRAANIADHKE